MRRLERSGFTLIEILIVVAIIGVLVTVLLAVLLSASEKGEVAKAKNFVNKALPAAIAKWQQERGKSDNTFPRSPNMVDGDAYWQGNASLYEELVTKPENQGEDAYIDKELFMVGKEGGKDVFLDPWQNFYIYRNYSQKRSASGKNKVYRGTRYNDNTYDIISRGPDGELYEFEGNNDDIYNGVAE
jgi:prepilin-type N-terminal cleavage/methylation domain-containing protein